MLSIALLTCTVIVQVPMAMLLFVKVTLVLPASGLNVPPHVFVTLGGFATTRFAGSVSVKFPSTAITLGLLMVKVSVEAALMATVAGLKLLVIWSGSRMMMPTLAVPPLEAASPAVVVYVKVVGVGVAVIANVPL